MSRIWRWVVRHRATVGFLTLALAVTVALVQVQVQHAALCSFQRRSWETQRQQIFDDAIPQKPTEAVLRQFPQIRPFYDRRNPLYAEQIRALNRHRDRKLAILGARPDC